MRVAILLAFLAKGFGNVAVDYRFHCGIKTFVVVVYHVTIVAIGHELLKKFWPMVIGCLLRTAGSSII